jgi:aarF domain-containing kinase
MEYAKLWVAMVPPKNLKVVEEICRGWGIGNIEIFQNIIRQGTDQSEGGPRIPREKRPKKSAAETGVLIKSKLKELLQDTSKFPKELILVGRCMNYIRAANWSHGSPIDRISVLAESAKEGLRDDGVSTGAKNWLISGAAGLLRWLPGRGDYNREVTK